MTTHYKNAEEVSIKSSRDIGAADADRAWIHHVVSSTDAGGDAYLQGLNPRGGHGSAWSGNIRMWYPKSKTLNSKTPELMVGLAGRVLSEIADRIWSVTDVVGRSVVRAIDG